jgi:hypothetical protein
LTTLIFFFAYQIFKFCKSKEFEEYYKKKIEERKENEKKNLRGLE